MALYIIIFIVLFIIYMILPWPVKIVVLIINFIVPDPIPIIDEVLMIAGLVAKTNAVGSFFTDHPILSKVVVAMVIIGAIVLLLSVLGS